MQTFRLVLPENLNHFGYLFGGYMLKWVDEMAWIAATLEYPNCKFVTIGMDQVEFKRSVKEGAILQFDMSCTRVGTTSVSYLVDVTQSNAPDKHSIFSTTVTMVRVDENGNKMAVNAD